MSTGLLPPAEAVTLSVAISAQVEENNLAEYMPPVREWLAGINRKPSTDEDFGDAEVNVKKLKALEELLSTEKARVIAAAEDVQKMFAQFDDATEELRVARLDLEKAIAKRKDEVKAEIVEEFLGSFDIDAMDARRHFLRPLQDQLKGKRTVESMRTACRVYQVTMQAGITKSREMIHRFATTHGAGLVMDRRELELKSCDSVEAELRRRWEAHKAAVEFAKAKAEADAAKAALAEAVKPAAVPEVGTSNIERPTSNIEGKTEVKPDETAAHEWATFRAACLAAFATVKEARGRLKFSANIAKAQGLANGMNATWGEWA